MSHARQPIGSQAPLPTFLRAAFDEASLEESRSTLVAVAPTGEILWVNCAWWDFARANGGDEVPTRFGVGASYFDGIAPPLRAYYEEALAGALRAAEPFEQDYECSSPDVFRLHHLRALPFGWDGLLLEHSLVLEREHGDDGDLRDEGGIVRQCSNCRRVERPSDGSWVHVRSQMVAPRPNVSHGICPLCVGFYWGVLLNDEPPTPVGPEEGTQG